MATLKPILVLACCVLPIPGALVAQTTPESIHSSIDALEQTPNPDAGLMIDALISLGAAYAEDEVYSRALEAFEEASELSRRYDGLFSDTLVDIFYLMQRTARAGDDDFGAEQFRQEAQRITWRALQETVRSIGITEGTDSPLYLDAMLDLARWLSAQEGSSNNAGIRSWALEARTVYANALELIEDEFDRDVALRVRVLRMMTEDIGRHMITFSNVNASSYSEFDQDARSFVVVSEPAELIRARRIIKVTDGRDPVLLATVQRDIGDWRLAAGYPQRALKSYREAWRTLSDLADGDSLKLLLFAEPQMLEGINDLRDFDSRYADDAQILERPVVSVAWRTVSSILSEAPYATQGQVELEFIVNETGLASDVRVISASPEWAANAGIGLIESTLFRPSFYDGEFVEAPSQYTWNFRYDPDLAAMRGLTD